MCLDKSLHSNPMRVLILVLLMHNYTYILLVYIYFHILPLIIYFSRIFFRLCKRRIIENLM
jgi:hypothetical protein